ncbi:hypothetical protein MNBD_GAMMA12-734 [hydrothermal vent metagenome]|uniref:Uncharacterized protein n=1 Tax=hydrothermal vent metagenome TaxID=652676 RepID=A0A3B0YQH1_9ZZZZ
MAILNVTIDGISVDYPHEIDFTLADNEIRRIATELVRSASLPGVLSKSTANKFFHHSVVDRFDTFEGGKRIYLRPRVPFG